MTRASVLLGAVLLLLASPASPAAADDSGGGPSAGGSVYLFTRDVPIPESVPLKQGVVGLGYQMTGKLGPGSHWGWVATGEYGTGSHKAKTSSTLGSSTTELSLSHWLVRFGFDYWAAAGGLQWYCGPGLSYQSTKLTVEQSGDPDEEYEPFKLYGLDAHAGAIHELSGKLRLFGETGMAFGPGSFEQTEGGVTTKLTGWFNTMSWRGGIRYGY